MDAMLQAKMMRYQRDTPNLALAWFMPYHSMVVLMTSVALAHSATSGCDARIHHFSLMLSSRL
jgi:hypothetical protein